MDIFWGAFLGFCGVVLAAVISNFVTIFITDKKAHGLQNMAHQKLDNDHVRILDGIKHSKEMVTREQHNLGKDVGKIDDKVDNIKNYVVAIDTTVKQQIQDHEIARNNLNKTQEKIMESVDHIKHLGEEMERLSHQNSELLADNQKLRREVADLTRQIDYLSKQNEELLRNSGRRHRQSIDEEWER